MRWEYTAEQWEAFLQGEWQRSKRRLTKMMLYFGGAGLGSGLLIAWMARDLALGMSIGTGSALLFGGLIPGLVLVGVWLSLRSGLAGPREVLIGPDGVQIGRRKLSFGFGGPRSVVLQPGNPRYLCMELHGKSSFDGPPMLYVAVPPGCEAQAEQVRDRLRAGNLCE